jgi:hypothetical protein
MHRALIIIGTCNNDPKGLPGKFLDDDDGLFLAVLGLFQPLECAAEAQVGYAGQYARCGSSEPVFLCGLWFRDI